MFEKKIISPFEIKKVKAYYARRWIDPVARVEDTFNVRRADGSLTKLKVPEPQRQMLRDGILGKSKEFVGTGVSYVGVTNKGRQLGFSVILAAEAVLIAEDFPGTHQYYVATASDQASDWTFKLNQLVEDANYWPEELGGGPILNVTNINKVFDKVINDTHIIGLSANPSAIRGKTGIAVYFDEAAWAIRFKGQAKETWKALKYIIRQGGQARIQSTPRTSDIEEFFWGMYKKGEEGTLAIHTYYCPVIENWKDLDLNEPLYINLDNNRRKLRGLRSITQEDANRLIKRYKSDKRFTIVPGSHIQQNAIIPYWWVNIEDLETDRASDIEQFKQENLGVPLDETYKLIKSEWIFSNLNEGEELDDRTGSTNDFYMLIDVAQKNDITAITVVEHIEDIYVERLIIETQKEYTTQRDIIFSLFLKFRPKIISIDNTGHGIPVADMIVRQLRDNSFDPNILKRVTFTMQSKEEMAVGFRNLVMPDPITGKSRYRWLYKKKKHEDAIRHCTRVEKELLPQGGIRYSGKMHGRDDHFWCAEITAEVLTSTGWKLIKDVKVGDTVPTLNIETQNIETSEVIDTFNKYYEGAMIEFKNKHIDLRVTPNHKMVAQLSKGANKHHPLRLIKAKDLMYKNNFKLKRNCIWVGKKQDYVLIQDNKIGMKLYMKLVGFLLSEGCLTLKRKIYIAQQKDGKARKQIKNALDNCNFDYKEHEAGFYIYNKDVVAHFKDLIGKKYSYEKRIPRHLLELDKEYLIHLYEGLMLGDGHKSGNVYYTSSKDLADDFQELLVRLEWSSSMKVYNRIGRKVNCNTKGVTRHKEYVISISKDTKKKNNLTPRFNHHKNWGAHPKIVQYTGNVVCFELDRNNTMLVRNNGKVVWSGNSKAQIALLEKPSGVPKAAFRKYARGNPLELFSKKKSYANRFLDEQNRKRLETNPEERETTLQIARERTEKIKKRKNLLFAIKCLTRGVTICRSKNKPVKPIHCASRKNCRNNRCSGYLYVKEICTRYGVEKNEIWEKQTTYPSN